MGKETNDILNHPNRFTYLSGYPLNIPITDIPLTMLYILQHLGDPGSYLPFNK
jgi:hypothetical protein